MNIANIQEKLLECYSKDLCYSKVKDKWSEENKSLGMCAITSLIINDYFDGDICKIYVDGNSHYFNLIENKIIDLTSNQYDFKIDYKNYQIVSREEILTPDTMVRYKTLKKRLIKALLKQVDEDYLCKNLVKIKFSSLDINDSFFDSLKMDYKEFISWYEKKKQEEVYCYKEENKILGLLVLKIEEPELEDYRDIKPPMKKNRKLKISTFKVDVKGKKVSERFMKIIFCYALIYNVDEIYFTVYDNDEKKINLIKYFEKFGFKYYGKKNKELVYIKIM